MTFMIFFKLPGLLAFRNLAESSKASKRNVHDLYGYIRCVRKGEHGSVVSRIKTVARWPGHRRRPPFAVLFLQRWLEMLSAGRFCRSPCPAGERREKAFCSSSAAGIVVADEGGEDRRTGAHDSASGSNAMHHALLCSNRMQTEWTVWTDDRG